MEYMESGHDHDSSDDEDGLSYTRIHCLNMNIPSIVDFFYEKNNWSQEACASEKYPNSHKRKSHLEIIERIHIEYEESDGGGAREKYEHQDEEVGFD